MRYIRRRCRAGPQTATSSSSLPVRDRLSTEDKHRDRAAQFRKARYFPRRLRRRFSRRKRERREQTDAAILVGKNISSFTNDEEEHSSREVSDALGRPLAMTV